MNFDSKGKIIAKIINIKNEKKRKLKKDSKQIYVTNDKKVTTFDNLDVDEDEERIQQMPDKDTWRSILYVTAPSGAGKSYYCKNYILEYKKVFPKNSIYLFSALLEDETLDSIKSIKRIKYNTEFMTNDFVISDFKHSLIIFDDVDAMTNKYLKEKVYQILAMILNTGRHQYVSVIYTSHMASKGNETKGILAECHSLTIFPKTAGKRSLQYLLESNFGLDTKQIKSLKKIDSRHITIVKSYPIVILAENKIFVLKDLD
jgi:hypothetical protein